MKIITIIFTICVFIRTVSYAMFEMKKQNNKKGAAAIIVIAVISLVLPNVFMWMR